MRKRTAAIGSAVFLVVGPGSVSGLVPWLITGWDSADLPGWWWTVRGLGAAAIAAGLAVIVHAFYRFVAEGFGTPVPAAPPRHLVVGGLFRYVRNPMYVALALMTGGQVLVFASWPLLIYLIVAWAIGLREGLRGTRTRQALRRGTPHLPAQRARLDPAAATLVAIGLGLRRGPT